MRFSLKVILIVLIILGINYWKEQKELKEMTEMIKTFQFASSEELDQLIIKKYPEELTYSSFKDDELKQMIHTLKILEMKEVKRLKRSDYYTKIILKEKEDGGTNQYKEFTLYHKGFIEYKEGSLVGDKVIYYQADPAQVNNALDSILAEKEFE